MRAAFISDPLVQPRLRALWMQEAHKEAVDLTEVQPHQVSLSITDAGCRVLFKGKEQLFDVMVLRTAGIFMPILSAAAEELTLSGIQTFNNPTGINKARDKIISARELQISGVPVVPTLGFFRGGKVHADDGPVIVKPAVGSQGRGVKLLDDVQSAREHLGDFVSAKTEGGLVLQPFLGPVGRDLRCFVVGGECVAVMRRFAPDGGYVNNAGAGGRREHVEHHEAADVAVRATRSLGLDYAGVDILETDPLRVLEVNSLPSFVALYETTGVNPAGHIWRHIKKEHKK